MTGAGPRIIAAPSSSTEPQPGVDVGPSATILSRGAQRSSGDQRFFIFKEVTTWILLNWHDASWM